MPGLKNNVPFYASPAMWGAAATLMASLIGTIATITAIYYPRFEDLDKKIATLEKENEKLKKSINDQTIYFKYIKDSLLFIYQRSDASSCEIWRKSLIENSDKVQRELDHEY
ncbi:hypothetical protein ACH50O_23460 (plasmid) [Methylomonas sp. 2BW1-5-20]|uniref:hypothetical protein n=1 Tax=Methylomonas sp. 2BW1-5-20 TaxID=3376686 RepID=UPI00404D9707